MSHTSRSSGICRQVAVSAAALGLMVASITGCGGSGDVAKTVISGAVSYDGQPIEDGTIRFVPTKDTRAPVSAAQIQNGRYSADARGGVPVGTYRVEIEAFRTDPKAPPGADTGGLEGPPPEQFIPEKYNRQSELELTLEPAGGPITRDFELKK